MPLNSISSLLIIGHQGGLAQLTMKILKETFPAIDIFGLDSRPLLETPSSDQCSSYTFEYTRGNFENLFRGHKFDAVINLSRIMYPNDPNYSTNRLNLGVMENRHILDLCLKYSIKKVIILSSYHLYGAFPDNPIFLKEDAPLRAGAKHLALQNVLEVDQMARNWMWKHQSKIQTIILRPCNIIGPQIKNTMTRFLKSPVKFYPIDYNPMLQFIHEFDMAQVLVKALYQLPPNIYNVAPDDFISLKESLQLTKGKHVPLPFELVYQILSTANRFFPSFPQHIMDQFKFSSLIDNSRLKKFLPSDFFRFDAYTSLKLLNSE